MFGDDMLVAPIAEKSADSTGLVSKRIWLPEGDWYEWFSGSMLNGGRVVERSFALHEIPLYVKAGSIIPLYPKRSNLQGAIDTLVLALVPGGAGATCVYEDDGATTDYKHGSFAWTIVTKAMLPNGDMNIAVHPREGRYKGAPKCRAYELRLPSVYPPQDVLVDGKPYGFSEEPKDGSWTYDAGRLTTHVFLPKQPCNTKTNVSIRWSAEAKQKQQHIDGKAGLFARLPKIAGMIKDEVNRRDNIANAPAPVLKALSLPTRIQYEPQHAVELLEEFDREYVPMLTAIMDYQRGDVRVLENIVRQFPSAPSWTATPVISIDTAISVRLAIATISCSDAPARIRYTLDGTLPTSASQVYSQPITIANTATLNAKAFRDGQLPSFNAGIFFQRVWAKSVTYEFPNSPRYTGGGDFALVNGRLGAADDYRVDWVGFQKVDLVATIALAQPRDITSITARFLQNQGSWIFLPTAVQYEASSDGITFRSVFQKDLKDVAETKSDVTDVFSFPAQCNEKNITHVRVRAKNIGVCPAWHQGAGGNAWVFADEVEVR